MYSIKQLKPGIAILFNDEPYVVTKSVFGKQARQTGNLKATLKNLKTGVHLQHTFSGSDKIEAPDLVRSRCQYLYFDGSKYVFMHNETYEQYEIDDELIAEDKYYLLEGAAVDVLFFEGNPIGVEVAPKVVLKVVDTTPGVRGDTAQGGSKAATLETGLVLQVPLFVDIGQSIRVNTEEGTYVERA